MMLVRRGNAKARLWSECRGSGSWGTGCAVMGRGEEVLRGKMS